MTNLSSNRTSDIFVLQDTFILVFARTQPLQAQAQLLIIAIVVGFRMVKAAEGQAEVAQGWLFSTGLGDSVQASGLVEFSNPFLFTVLQARHQLVHDVLHDPVQFEVEQWLCLVDLDVAHGAVLAGLEVLHNTTFAESMETLCDGGGIHEVASAQAADDVFIQVFDFYSDLLLAWSARA